MQGKAWAPICRAAANLGVRARGWKAGEISGEYRGRALREEGEETGVWGHGVSGSGRSRVLRSQAPTGGPGGAVRVALAGERGGPCVGWSRAARLGQGREGGLGRGVVVRLRLKGGVRAGPKWARGKGEGLGCWVGFCFGFFLSISKLFSY